MKQKKSLSPLTSVLIVDSLLLAIFVVLQFLDFEMAPAIDPNNKPKTKDLLRDLFSNQNQDVLIEVFAFALIVTTLDYLIFRKSKRNPLFLSLVMGLVFLIIAGVVVTYYLNDYADRNI
jgi:hypothetical protein